MIHVNMHHISNPLHHLNPHVRAGFLGFGHSLVTRNAAENSQVNVTF